MREARGEVPPRYRADIDGLRAIAVTSVVLFHAHLFPFASGYVGVDIFFVISGYLIGGIILRDVSARRFSFATFYARRARRILPALITVVLACCLAGWFLLSPNQFRDVGATAASALLGVSNIGYFKFRDYFAPDARLHPLLMTWSLGVEEQFYLCFPFLVFGIGRWAPRKTLAVLATVVLVSFFAALWCTYTYPAAAFYLLPFRAWELGAGVILAFIELARDADRRPVETIRHDDRFNDRIAGRSVSRALARLVPARYQAGLWLRRTGDFGVRHFRLRRIDPVSRPPRGAPGAGHRRLDQCGIKLDQPRRAVVEADGVRWCHLLFMVSLALAANELRAQRGV